MSVPALRPSAKPAPEQRPDHPGTAGALLSAMRPRQWTKSLLVLAAPLAGGSLLSPGVALAVTLAVASFTAAACAVYLVNDVHDAERDRLHPRKCLRPIAAGRLRPAAAQLAAAVLAGTAVAAPIVLRRPGLAVVVGLYLLLAAAYGRGLKHVPGVEIAIVAAGFLLRAVGGAVATGVPPSRWFLLVCTSGALVAAFGKRCAELRQLGVLAVRSRPVLAHYTSRWLVAGRRLASIVTAGAYLAWAATRGGDVQRGLAMLSALPFAAALVGYARCNERGLGESPEDLLLSDRPMQLLAAGWLLVYTAAVIAS